MTTICYITSRKTPRIQWFFDSLIRQLGTDPVKLVIVDRWAEPRPDWTKTEANDRITRLLPAKLPATIHLLWTSPKPTVWAGRYRLTTQDYFAASNARNTGLCLADDGWIVYVDDLSILLPGWWEQVKLAIAGGYVACGAFRKVNKLVVGETGLVQSFEDHPAGHDTRLAELVRRGQDPTQPFDHQGDWLYGASVAMPVQALLDINGWDENLDAISGEDYLCGMALSKLGLTLKYVPAMMTWESEEDHHVEPPAKRIIKPYPEGHTYKDCSHAVLHQALAQTRIWNPNYQNMAETRAKVLSGEHFPVIQVPEHHWVDGQPLREM